MHTDTDHTEMRVSAQEAAMVILFALQNSQKIRAVKFIKGWCGCNLRTAMNMMDAFDHMGGSNTSKMDRIAAALPLGKMAEVVDIQVGV